MIEKMCKVHCAARARDRERLLDAVRDLGVVHLVPVEPARAQAPEATVEKIDMLGRAVQVLGQVEAAGPAPDLAPEDAAREVLTLSRRAVELRSRLGTLHRQVEQLAMWGDTPRAMFEELRNTGFTVRFYTVPAQDAAAIEAECVQDLGETSAKRRLVAAVTRGGEPAVPESAQHVPLPKADRPTVKAEAAQADAELKAGRERLAALAGLKPALAAAREALQEEARYHIAAAGAFAGDALLAVQGWVPEKKAEALARGLADAGVEAVVEAHEPSEDETPPTLINYPAWTRPIKGLFDILGTLPGYREFDLSAFFMIAMPLFAAILIGDGGYGFLFTVAALAFYKKAVAAGQAAKVQLLLVLGLTTLVWGLLSGSVFGLGPMDFVKAGGAWENVGRAFNGVCLVGRVADADIAEALAAEEPARKLEALQKLSDDAMAHLRLGLMKLSFIIAVLHLAAARLREALALAPNQRALASVGWAVLLCGMFGIVWYMFFTMQEPGGSFPGWTLVLVAVGAGLAVLFSAPRRHPAARIGIGLASSLLPAMSTFSDTMSYIRLMAVSMASVYIGQVFNMLGAQLAGVATWAAGAPIVVLGHGLNIGLCLIAIFAHGVRLNMLEFSNNAGVQWGGYPFEPFARSRVKES